MTSQDAGCAAACKSAAAEYSTTPNQADTGNRTHMVKKTDNSIFQLYGLLFRRYGEQHWWPCVSGERWEIAAGAVLTQNCAWNNVEKALARLAAAKLDTPGRILSASDAAIREAIRSAGFFRQKAVYLKALAAFFRENEKAFASVREPEAVWALRARLLAVQGCGRETADSILLYAFAQPVFVIDAYTRRVAVRHLGLEGTLPYDELQRVFMAHLPPDVQLYNEYHALIVRLAKDSCRKSGCGEFCRQNLQRLTASR